MRVRREDPAAPGAIVGRRRRGGGRGLSLAQRAALRFGAADAAQTVAGLTRTLGAPRVSIGSIAGSPAEARITFAWELCWYQWAVDCSAAEAPVRLLARGERLDQLEGAARQWNATVAADGTIVIGPSR